MAREPLLVSVSLEVLLSYAFAISAVLMAVNYRTNGAIMGAGLVVIICALIGGGTLLARDSVVPTSRAIQIWLTSELIPALGIYLLSRFGFAKSHPWSLLVAGPLAFFVMMVVCSTVYAAVRIR